MKFLHYTLGLLCSFCLMIILFITSIEAVAYWTPGYYEKEYRKYNVTEAVNMEMEDLLDVTKEMMSYLKGKRENLNVETSVGGVEREFFNEREIAHMADVQGLFLAAITIRRICLAISILCILLLVVLKSRVKQVLPKSICIGTGMFFAMICILSGIISTDFSKYFVVFHKIFFTNDLWLLDPQTDLLINIVPEPFFVDTAIRIGLTYGVSVLVLLLLCIFYIRTQKSNTLTFTCPVK